MTFTLHWIPLLPLLGAAICLVGARRLPRALVHLAAVGSVGAAAVVAAHAATVLHGAQPRVLHESVYPWIASGDLRVPVALLFDPLSATMTLIVTFVGFLIHVYSMGYMREDPCFARYFGYLNLFTGSMLVLVLADSLPLMFVGWEGVGACSYLLIGFWFDKSENASAGKKAFIVNRIGDLGFLLGMFLIWSFAGTLDFGALHQKSDALLQTWRGQSVATWAALLLFVGACGKSAQLPLYVWLPDAMAGPTPVSALIHAATMVTAGVYMVARLHFVYMLSPLAMTVVAVVGAATALFSATIGFAQTDIKKVLAYSTVSQLGFMFLGVGSGAFSAGIFHVFTHAFFKACLFLGAGSVIHALHGRQDVAEMGGLRRPMPLTHATFLVSTAAIAGVPLLSGFFSKDEILVAAFARHWALGAVGIVAAACTAVYMTRLYCLTFTGASRADEHTRAHLHESESTMTGPLLVLGLGAIGAGYLGWFLRGWLALPEPPEGPHVLAMVLSILASGAGIAAGVLCYWGGERAPVARLVAAAPWLYSAVHARYMVDELYDAVAVRPTKKLALFCHEMLDRRLIDGLGVHIGPWFADRLGAIARLCHNGDVQRYIAAVALGATVLLWGAAQPKARFRAEVRGREMIARAVVPRDRVVRLRWDLDGDGRFDVDGDQAEVHHTFDRPGRYQVTLLVEDARWRTTARASGLVVIR
jgi:NADH-quinone oxidoreductase subunit L